MIEAKMINLTSIDSYGNITIYFSGICYLWRNVPEDLISKVKFIATKNIGRAVAYLTKYRGKGTKISEPNHELNYECSKGIVHLLKTNADKQAFEEYAERIGG
jgi:hypothetical protein